MLHHERFIKRCLELAENGIGKVFPNPLVGSVITCDGKIVGMGFHSEFGGKHAEIEALNNLKIANSKVVPENCTLYVNLEPCAHHGKTPPCVEAIINSGIKNVVIGTEDPNQLVSGKGIRILLDSGLKVESGVLVKECETLNNKFFTFHKKKRPFITLKWARSSNNMIDSSERKINQPILRISNEYAHQMVHKMRAEHTGIWVGYNTILRDDPMLNVRSVSGKDPWRITFDRNNSLDTNSKFFRKEGLSVVFNEEKNEEYDHLKFVKTKVEDYNYMMTCLWEMGCQSVLIEGGSNTLNKFIENELWDEAYVFTSEQNIKHGIEGPSISSHFLCSENILSDNSVSHYSNNS